MIATLFGKKKITEEKLSNIFVNAAIELTEHGFAAVAAEVNESPEFDVNPALAETDDRAFGMIVLAANLIEAKRVLGPGVDKRMCSLVVSKYAHALGEENTDLENEVRSLQSQMERLNFPSKNTVYAMSKVLFHSYDLFCFQDPYFREIRVPNPIILKRLNGLMGYFLWNWAEVNEQYRIV
ncbi:MAG: hypothetical protein IPH05_16865 [Flavobacteriales bacterium]|jgi:hypothetical protein|nr:hypothetical protein [Flavobacteriales bacterium]MBK6548833.1 hypothetical protein [Flavobacteriales bacterium]MBK6884569.1 hypothetical protein [Flavobacteriales bacterium]MBK7100970.1 hypothetical protein [Flavobacteriales bacterium]MBK7111655.1 hypothetical protein [Flavobacteriales bacterium]